MSLYEKIIYYFNKVENLINDKNNQNTQNNKSNNKNTKSPNKPNVESDYTARLFLFNENDKSLIEDIDSMQHRFNSIIEEITDLIN